MERRAFDLNEVIDRHGLRIRVEVGKLRDQACAFAARFPHPDDTAAAHGNAGRADTRERIEAILIDARRHDLAVELGRGVEIVIVVIEAGVLQRLRLAGFQHAERAAGLEAFGLDRTDQIGHVCDLAILRSSPRSAHAKSRCAGRPGSARRLGNFRDSLQRFVRNTGVVARGLRTIGAVFGTAAGLDRQQRRQLHAVRRVMRAMDTLRFVEEVDKRAREQRLDVVDRESRLRGHPSGRFTRLRWGVHHRTSVVERRCTCQIFSSADLTAA